MSKPSKPISNIRMCCIRLVVWFELWNKKANSNQGSAIVDRRYEVFVWQVSEWSSEQDTDSRQVGNVFVCLFYIEREKTKLCQLEVTRRVLHPVIPSADRQPVRLLATLAHCHQVNKKCLFVKLTCRQIVLRVPFAGYCCIKCNARS